MLQKYHFLKMLDNARLRDSIEVKVLTLDGIDKFSLDMTGVPYLRLDFPVLLSCRSSSGKRACDQAYNFHFFGDVFASIKTRCSLTQSMEKLFCPVCSAIQPVEGRSYFDCLGLFPRFDIDLSLLKINFLKLQSVVHPDKFSKCSQEEKEISEKCSRYLNEAYKTLTEPLERAKYLLTLKGEPLDDEYAIDNTDFLVEMMELNELVVACNDSKELKILLNNVENKTRMLGKEFKNSIETNQLGKAKEALFKLTFYHRLKSSLSSKIIDNE
ncbi:unnamed protein product [Litomosoides sigmodontis]|uniref:J domain-containing protein n=1 Tax=Litomosoides sigmodontis TaxID=42156 RepID=A0A3P6SG06_LITSI|nr:unnamed protein product [Litomosoides sigmodontis]